MTLSRLAADLPSALILGSVPYFPPVVSDIVIDLSHWQAPVDFVRAKSAGIAAVILKATQGLYWIDGHSLHGSPPQQPPGCSLGPITFSIIRRRISKSRTFYR